MANFKLSFKAGKLAGREETFSVNEVTMGRNPAHPLSVNDAQVSRDHLRIFFKDGVFFLEDLGSTNGCLLYTSPSPRDRTRSRMPSSA